MKFNCKIFFRHYSITVFFSILVLAIYLSDYFFTLDVLTNIYGKFKEVFDVVGVARTEEEVFSTFIIGVSLIIDYMRLLRRNKRKRAMDTERLLAARSTLASVHDVVNNSLNNLLLVKMEAEEGKPLSPETLVLFGDLIDDMAAQIRNLDEINIITRRDLSSGISVLAGVGEKTK